MEIDRIKPNHGKNAREQRRNTQLRREDAGDRAGQCAGNQREHKSGRQSQPGSDRRSGSRCAQRERALHRQIGNVENAEGQKYAERKHGPLKALADGRDQKIEHENSFVGTLEHHLKNGALDCFLGGRLNSRAFLSAFSERHFSLLGEIPQITCAFSSRKRKAEPFEHFSQRFIDSALAARPLCEAIERAPLLF